MSKIKNNNYKMKQKKICILIDNPSRDLQPLLLLALKLIDLDFSVYLVEQYNKKEIYLICPDIVILQTLRNPHLEILKNCKHSKIAVCILDSEGGYDSNRAMKAIIYEMKKNLKFVNLYFSWGKYHYFNFKKILRREEKKKLILSGSPKSDLLYFYRFFYKNIKKKYILINTSFPLANPRFNSPKKEFISIKNQLRRFGKKSIENLFKDQVFLRKKFLELINYLAKKFPKTKFVIRPHPFEDFMNYENNVSKYSNIEISKNKSLYINILESLGMIQFNCTTAFEYLAITKKKSIFPIFLKNNYKINKEMLAVSNIVDSLFKFEMKIRKLITVKQKKERFLNLNFIENIFYKIDGCATDRIVNNISKIIVNKNDYKIKKNFYLFKNFKES